MEINLLKYFKIKRFINVIKVLSSFGLSRIYRKPIVWGMPISFSIEPTNHCNLQCPECPSGLGTLTRPLGLLKLSDFKEWIDQIKSTGFYVQLFFQGEPYINKNLPEMIKYAQSQNIYVSISTNGHFVNEKNVDLVVDNAPDKLIFSVDGLDEESYQKYRVGGTFEQADKGLRALINRRNELGLKKPFVEFQFIVMKHNENQLDDGLNRAPTRPSRSGGGLGFRCRRQGLSLGRQLGRRGRLGAGTASNQERCHQDCNNCPARKAYNVSSHGKPPVAKAMVPHTLLTRPRCSMLP